jgi:hypothetical protein
MQRSMTLSVPGAQARPPRLATSGSESPKMTPGILLGTVAIRHLAGSNADGGLSANVSLDTGRGNAPRVCAPLHPAVWSTVAPRHP